MLPPRLYSENQRGELCTGPRRPWEGTCIQMLSMTYNFESGPIAALHMHN